jgi:hypothetical protein
LDFADLDLSKIRESEEEREDDNKSVSTFDSGVTPTHSSRQECDPSDVIDKKSFLHSMYRMSQRKRWIQTVSRRYSKISSTNLIDVGRVNYISKSEPQLMKKLRSNLRNFYSMEFLSEGIKRINLLRLSL